MLRGEGAMLLVMGDTLLLPLLFSTLGLLFLVRFSREFRSMAAEVRFSRRDPAEPAMALAKKGGRKLALSEPPGGVAGGRNRGGCLPPDGPGAASIRGGPGNF